MEEVKQNAQSSSESPEILEKEEEKLNVPQGVRSNALLTDKGILKNLSEKIKRGDVQWNSNEVLLFHHCLSACPMWTIADETNFCVLLTNKRLLLLEDGKVLTDVNLCNVKSVRHMPNSGVLRYDCLAVLLKDGTSEYLRVSFDSSIAIFFLEQLQERLVLFADSVYEANEPDQQKEISCATSSSFCDSELKASEAAPLLTSGEPMETTEGEDLSWYEKKSSGTAAGKTMTAGGVVAMGASAAGAFLAASNPIGMAVLATSAVAGAVSTGFGYHLTHKFYDKDPQAMREYKAELLACSFMQGVQTYSFENVLKVLETQELKDKVSAEVATQTFSQMWQRYDAKYAGIFLEREWLSGQLYREKVLAEIMPDSMYKKTSGQGREAQLPFRQFCSTYGRFVMSRGLLEPAEVAPLVLAELETSVLNVSQFLKLYWVWPCKEFGAAILPLSHREAYKQLASVGGMWEGAQDEYSNKCARAKSEKDSEDRDAQNECFQQISVLRSRLVKLEIKRHNSDKARKKYLSEKVRIETEEKECKRILERRRKLADKEYRVQIEKAEAKLERETEKIEERFERWWQNRFHHSQQFVPPPQPFVPEQMGVPLAVPPPGAAEPAPPQYDEQDVPAYDAPPPSYDLVMKK